MRILEKPGYTFDDVLLVPSKSLASRSVADTQTRLAGNLHLSIPIISANMDTVTELSMALAMHTSGGIGILHRYATPETVIGWIETIERQFPGRAIPSVGLSFTDRANAEKYWQAGARIICVDVANAYSAAAIFQVSLLKRKGWTVIAGNVATPEGLLALASVGADVVKVGIGPGSVCTTRLVTGHGVPQLTAIMDCAEALSLSVFSETVKIIADGGIRNSGDIVKALAAGAHAVMLGGLLAGCDETPSQNGLHVYRGMASNDARVNFVAHGGSLSWGGAEEGTSTLVDSKGSVVAVLYNLVAGLKSGMSYSGAHTLYDLREFSEFMVVTPNAVKENGPHGLSNQ